MLRALRPLRAGHPRCFSSTPTRFKARVVKMKPKDRTKEVKSVERDAMGRPILKARERSLGAFKPLPVGGLMHELFEPASEGPGRVELDVPSMRPRLLSPGVVTRFHDTEPTSPLRVYGVPKKMLLEFRILGVPCSVTTSTTLSLVRVLEESVSSPSRLVLNGRAGCGKSFLLLQAAEYAAASSAWLVLYIPRARRLVDASTPYTYSLRTRTYLQPRAARETLRRIGTANAHILRFLNTTAPIQLENGDALPEGTPLLDVVKAGQGEEGEPAAHACLEGIIREMATQTVFPLLIAIDDFQALTGRSMYRDPQGRFIRPHHLGIPRLLLEYASGRKPVARGCVLTALSRTDPEFPVPPQLAAALHLPADFDASPASRVGMSGKMGGSGRYSSQLAAYLEHEVEVEDPAFIEDEYDETDPQALAADGAEESEEGANNETDVAYAEDTSGADTYVANAGADSSSASVAEDAGVELDSEAAAELSAAEAEVEASAEVEEEVEEEAEVEEGEEEALDAPWTGWRVYDPPLFEDALVSTPAQPEPAHPPEGAGLWKGMVLSEEGEALTVGSSNQAVEGEEGEGEDGGEAGAGGKTIGTGGQQGRGPGPAVKKVRALRAIRVPDALSVREAAALFEVWLDTGVLRTGNERRAARRAELSTLEEYKVIKAETDAESGYVSDSDSEIDPESVAFDDLDADTASTAADDLLASLPSPSGFTSTSTTSDDLLASLPSPSDSTSTSTSASTSTSGTSSTTGARAAWQGLAWKRTSAAGEVPGSWKTPSASAKGADASDASEEEEDGALLSEAERLQRWRDRQRELRSEEYDEVRAVENALKAEAWWEEREQADAEVESLDVEMARERRVEEGLDVAAEMDGWEGAEGAEDVEIEEMEHEMEGEEAEVVAEDDLLPVPGEYAEEDAALTDSEDSDPIAETESSDAEESEEFYSDGEGEEAESEAEVDDDELHLGDDAELAATLSRGVRAALEHPGELSGLMRDPLLGEPRVEPESGADELFLGKYAESGGNARAFVWGGLLGTLQTST